jgi:crotonobetainyl-CoA:carnitine CoA-transferase CaiB-like acyl-CoA transferase
MRNQYTVPYGPYHTLDGLIHVAAASDQHWKPFCAEVLDHPKLVPAHPFRIYSCRTENHAKLDGVLAPPARNHEWRLLASRTERRCRGRNGGPRRPTALDR